MGRVPRVGASELGPTHADGERAKAHRRVAEITEEGRKWNAKDSKAAKKTRRR